MRLVHIGDSHLGLSQFSRLDGDGMNLRERLVYSNFLEGIDAILRLRPDAVVHAGDLFHSVRPRTPAYTTALEALSRLGDAGVPLVVIAGNHDMMKSRYTTSPFEVLEYHSAPVHACYRYRYEHVDLGDTRFHLIPNLLQPDQYREEFDRVELLGNGKNVLVTHGLASTLKDRRLGTVMEHEIDATMLSPGFDYIALGHFHGRIQVAQNAWYCGAQEYITYAEIGDDKGGLLVELDRHTVEPLALPHTPMVDLGELDCRSLTSREVAEGIAEKALRVSGSHSRGAPAQVQRGPSPPGQEEPLRTSSSLDAPGIVPRGPNPPGQPRLLRSRVPLRDPGSPQPPMAVITLTGADRRVLQAMDPAILQEARSGLLFLKITVRSDTAGSPPTERRDLRGVNYVELFGEYLKGRGLDDRKLGFVSAKGSEIIRKVMEDGEGGDDAAP